MSTSSLNTGTIKVEVENIGTLTGATNPEQDVEGKVVVPARVKGLDGKNTVWVGAEPPTDDYYEVWVNPEGQAISIVNTVNGRSGEVTLDTDDVGVRALTNMEIEALLK